MQIGQETSQIENPLQGTFSCYVSGGAISWSSKKQKCVALSTAEAEYVALSSAVQECIWLRQLEVELENVTEGPSLILEDNRSAIYTEPWQKIPNIMVVQNT